MNDVDIEKIKIDPICQKWIIYCHAENKNDTRKWYEEKQKFWEENKEHLKQNGFSYTSNLSNALDEVELIKEEAIEGCLLIIKLGSETRPATEEQIDNANQLVKELLKGVKGVRAVVTHHDFNISKISLPQLRSLQSAVLSSVDEENINPIMELSL